MVVRLTTPKQLGEQGEVCVLWSESLGCALWAVGGWGGLGWQTPMDLNPCPYRNPKPYPYSHHHAPPLPAQSSPLTWCNIQPHRAHPAPAAHGSAYLIPALTHLTTRPPRSLLHGRGAAHQPHRTHPAPAARQRDAGGRGRVGQAELDPLCGLHERDAGAAGGGGAVAGRVRLLGARGLREQGLTSFAAVMGTQQTPCCRSWACLVWLACWAWTGQHGFKG